MSLLRLAAALALLLPAPLFAGSAKVLLYHHVSTETPAATSVTPDMFRAHLELLESSGYQVVPLQRIVDTLVNAGQLESNWVAITFDDAYRSVLTEAHPLLADRGWPYTIFTSTEFIDKGYGLYLSWDELRQLEASGVTIANHTLSHEHMVRTRPGESSEAWIERLTREVMSAQQRLEAELDEPLRLFAYPYGEFDADVAALMRSLGFIAFGQQSGPIGPGSPLYALPRFPLASGFDSVASLAEKLRTEQLPLLDAPVPAVVLSSAEAQPQLELTLAASDIRPEGLRCFVAGQPDAEVVWLDERRIRITALRPLRPGRSKYTCTAPHPTVPRAYYWHTQLWIKPFDDGSWYPG